MHMPLDVRRQPDLRAADHNDRTPGCPQLGLMPKRVLI